uniref:Uncharacterized protein n=1 Tax=Trichogramma kaykai TaxID=54128 RepID=A0ABD2WV71_9HYME
MAQENLINRGIEEKSHEFLRHLHSSIKDYEGQFPNLRDIFRPEAIDWLIARSLKERNYYAESNPVINFVINSGYKDEPEVDEYGKPLLRRATPVHLAIGNLRYHLIPDLFKIYDKFDVNYTDDDGYTHFHIACEAGCYDVKKFLELGQDPNCIVPKTGESPLHLALRAQNKELAILLLRSGANPNLANKDGATPLHIICQGYFNIENMTEILFEINSNKSQTLQFNARTKNGDTPLHFAMQNSNRKMIEFLLRNGADPNMVNNEGFTPLQGFLNCSLFGDANNSLRRFFKINGELNQLVQVDAKDKLGRTPLQLAIVNLMPHCIDVLLEFGADVSSFVFPTESYFTERYKNMDNSFEFRLKLVSCLLIIVERLERRGYQMDRNNALAIMQLFAKQSLFEKSTDLEKYWVNEEFTGKAKEMMITSSLSLYDVIQLRPEEAVKLFTLEDYYEFASSENLWRLPGKGPVIEACARCLCEKISRGFCRRWAVDFFLELTKYQLPILCCEIIIDKLMNEDLINICLAAAFQDS